MGSMLTRLPAVFILCLEEDPTVSTRLLSVNKASQEWLVPFVYHSIAFTTASKLVAFHRIHDVPEERLSQRLNLIHNLYIGAAPDGWSNRGDLLYASDVWPMTILCRIFWMCENLESLALLYLDQNKWQRLEYAIPASLKKLVLGPIHGPFHASDLRKRPQLEHFTSADSFMRDDEVVDVMTYPSLRTFRRMSDSLTNGVALFSTDQVECISHCSATLEKYEIVLCNTRPIPVDVSALIVKTVREVVMDPRIYITSVPDRRWVTVIYDEYCDFRHQHFRSLA